LFVAGGTISVVNCFTNTTIASIPVASPNALVVNSSTNLLYASASTNLYVVNCSNYQVVATIPTSTTIGQFDLNTALNTLYYQNGTSFSILNGYTNTNVATVTNSNTGTYYISSNSSDPTFNVYNSNNTTSFQVHGINGNFNGGGINSAAGNAFYPTSTNSMSLGAPYNLWTNVYSAGLTVENTSGTGFFVASPSGTTTVGLTVNNTSGTGLFNVSATNSNIIVGSTGTNVPINYNLSHCVDAIGLYEYVVTVTTLAASSNIGFQAFPSGKSITNVRMANALMYDGTSSVAVSPNMLANTTYAYSITISSSGITCTTASTWTDTSNSKTFYIWVWMT
jgi:hypothetical protein